MCKVDKNIIFLVEIENFIINIFENEGVKKLEVRKSSVGLIVAVVVLIMTLLFGGTLLVLSSVGYLSFKRNEVKEEQVNDDNNDVSKENVNNDSDNNTLLLTNDEALSVSKELVKKYFEYNHALGPYCGEINGQDYLSFGSYETQDFRDYSASVDFKSIDELKKYFATFMVQDLFPKYLNDGVSYLEKDGKLYCQLSHKGPGETYNESKSFYVINSMDGNKIVVGVILISDVVENVTNTREGIVEIVKNSEGNWLISKYDVMISDLD